MNLAKISANGQITVPVEIRRLLGLKSGDKILFFQKQDGEVVVRNASTQAIRKAPKYLPDAEVLLAEMSYELLPAIDHAEKLIRDAKGQPILNAAIVSDVDMILTGDKDFLCLDITHPRCLTVTQFLEDEGVIV